MSKFCQMCNQVTNCTDNCDACMKEEKENNKMQTLNWNAWGKDHPVTFRLDNYSENGNLYVGMITWEEGWPEPWSDLTVNLSVKCAKDCAFIDTNNNSDRIVEWLITNKLATLTGRIQQSGFCVYPEMKFNMVELRKYI